VGGQRIEDRRFELLNIEQQNKEPQNDEVITSIFEIPCSIFCGFIKSAFRNPHSEIGEWYATGSLSREYSVCSDFHCR
jgi:hypothetical protein